MSSVRLSSAERRGVLSRYPELAWFTYDHLPPHLARISERFSDLAWEMASMLPQGAIERGQVRRCLERLEEAKDCAVRAKVGRPQTGEEGQEVRGD